MKKLLLLTLLVLSLSINSQNIVKINYWEWSKNHLKSEPQKWNRYDSWNYMPRYYNNFGISFTLKPFRWQKPNNYFLYREKKKIYKFIF